MLNAYSVVGEYIPHKFNIIPESHEKSVLQINIHTIVAVMYAAKTFFISKLINKLTIDNTKDSKINPQ